MHRAVEHLGQVGIGLQHGGDIDAAPIGQDQLLAAAVERHARLDHQVLAAAAFLRMLDHLQPADRPGAVQHLVVQVAQAAMVILLVGEVPRDQELAVEVIVPDGRVQPAGKAGFQGLV